MSIILKISIIIRTKNENRWLGWLLDVISDQKKVKYEIIIVNNGNLSNLKKTLINFSSLDIKIINIKKYRPGYALNKGIEKSKYNLITMISSHCIPANDKWLFNLNLPIYKSKNCFACYGRQEPLSFTPLSDKRDLAIAFGIESRKQFKDPFFHNANSSINKKYWSQIKFDSKVPNIEDRIWAEKIQKKFKKYIFYQPKASVYHWHGIHHTNNINRLDSTSRVLNEVHFGSVNLKKKVSPLFFIPFSSRFVSISLLKDTIESILNYDSKANIFISTTKNFKKELSKLIKIFLNKNIYIYIRNKIYDKSIEPLDFVYKDLSRFALKKSFSLYSPVVCIEVKHGIRTREFFRLLINHYYSNRCTSVFPSLKMNLTIINIPSTKNINSHVLNKINENLIPKDLNQKNKNFAIIKSYGFISSLDLLNILDLSGSKPNILDITKFHKGEII